MAMADAANRVGRPMLAMVGLAALLLAAPAAEAEEVRVPVPFAQGQIYDVTISITQGPQAAPALGSRGTLSVVEAGETGFVVEERTLDITVTPTTDDATAAFNAQMLDTVSSALEGAVMRVAVTGTGSVDQVLNLDTVRTHVLAAKETILDEMGANLAADGLAPDAIREMRAATGQVLDEAFLASDAQLEFKVTEGLSILTMPMGMTFDTQTPTTYGDLTRGDFGADGTAGVFRVLDLDRTANSLRVEWVQTYAPDLLEDQTRAIMGTLAQFIPDAAERERVLADLKVERVDTTVYEIALDTGMPATVVTQEVISVNGTPTRTTTKVMETALR